MRDLQICRIPASDSLSHFKFSVASLFPCFVPLARSRKSPWFPCGYLNQGITVPNQVPTEKREASTSSDANSRKVSIQKRLERAKRLHQFLESADVTEGTRIGVGGFAEVFVGEYKQEKVAVKKFIHCDDDMVAIFLSEVETMSSLKHSNVITFVGFICEPEKPNLSLIMEFVAGPLRRYCTPDRGQSAPQYRLSFEEKLVVSRECWTGLAYLHERLLCHKDIGPDNVLVEVSEDGRVLKVKITDFGLSKFKEAMNTMWTGGGGTYMYFPPEVARFKGQLRHPIASDVYSMAATLCELFSEQFFWNINGKARDMPDVIQHLAGQLQNTTEIAYPDCWLDVPASVRSMLSRGISPNYKKRFTAQEMLYLTLNLIEPEIPVHVLSHGKTPFLGQLPLVNRK